MKIRMRTRRTETIPPFRETVLFCFVFCFVFSICDLFLLLIFYLFVFFSYSFYDVDKVLLKTSSGSTELSPLEAALSLLLLSCVVRRDKMPLANKRTRSAGFNFFLFFATEKFGSSSIRQEFSSFSIFDPKVKPSKQSSHTGQKPDLELELLTFFFINTDMW